MKRSRKFSHFILLLLIVNSIFFIAWYGFDLKGTIKKIVEREIGKALEGKAVIGELSIGERQIRIEDFSFAAADSSLNIDAKELRVRYNMLKLIFGGFKIRDALNHVDITQPTVSLRLRPEPDKPEKPSKKFEIPDLLPYFTEIRVTDGKFNLDMELDIKLVNDGILTIREGLEQISITAKNDKLTRLTLTAKAREGGNIKVEGILDKGRLVAAEAEIKNYQPARIEHPDLRGLRTDLNLVATARQPKQGGNYELDAELMLWGTSLTLMNKYPVSLPYLHAKGTQDRLRSEISNLRVAESSMSGYLEITNILNDIGIDASIAIPSFDLALLEQDLTGRVSAQLEASGSLKEPVIRARASAARISYQTYTITDLALTAQLQDQTATIALTDASWEGQSFIANATFSLETYLLSGELSTSPTEGGAQELFASGAATFDLDLNQGLPSVVLELSNLNIDYKQLSLRDLNGSAHLIPILPGTPDQAYLLTANITGSQGFEAMVMGDLASSFLVIDLILDSTHVSQIYALESIDRLDPILAGTARAYLEGGRLVFQSDLDMDLSGDFNYIGRLSMIGSYNLNTGNAAIALDSPVGWFNDEIFDFSLNAELIDQDLTVHSLQISDLLSLSGEISLSNLLDFRYELAVTNLKNDNLLRIYPALGELLPDFGSINIRSSYDWDEPQKIYTQLNLGDVQVPGIAPLATQIIVEGHPEAAVITGYVRSGNNELALFEGDLAIREQVALNAGIRFRDLRLSDIARDMEVDANLSGYVSASYIDFLKNPAQPELTVDAHATNLSLPGFDIDSIDIVASQKDEILILDALNVYKDGMISLTGSGALDYNLLSNQYYEGDNLLSFDGEIDLFAWLENTVDYITEAKGIAGFRVKMGVDEDQFYFPEGEIKLAGASLKLKDQTESIHSINLSAEIVDNRVHIDQLIATMGAGQLVLRNYFSEDVSNHFQAANLDLGIVELKIGNPGIQVNIPMFTSPRSLSQITLGGQPGEWATVMGPFDDMQIKAHAKISRAAAVYPPDTSNLLKLIYTVRDAAFSREIPDPIPLPFNMDLLITVQENVNYVTYPTNIAIEPGSYLHLKYNGLDWGLSEASFSSERGTIDFFGTVFQVDQLLISIMESQEIMMIDGTFIRRAPDGTMITLSVTTDRDNTKGFFDRLQFSLSSDNPQDLSISQVLARMRYSSPNDELSNTQGQNMFADEAINLISGNLNTSLISPILYPVENSIRRFLKLDAFSINIGFIQNLVTEYSNDPEQLAAYADFKQFSSDIVQFSSAILLNNLSLSASKYLIGKLYLDYKLTLQEATDLQKNTLLLISHDTSLRMMLPWRLRLSYNLGYEATERKLSHGLMLQRSFRFWGL